MIGKRALCCLMVALIGASVPHSVNAASSRAATTFAPRSSIASADPFKKDARLQQSTLLPSEKDLSTRGGASGSPNELVSAASLFAIDYAVRQLFAAYDIKFPAVLGGCIILFVVLLLCDVVKAGLGNDIFVFLSPGAALLAKWLPVFFIPGLAILPKAPSLGGGLDILKILSVVVVGFVYSLTTTVFAASFILSSKSPAVSPTVALKKGKKAIKGGAGAPTKPYSPETLKTLVTGSVITGAISLAATKSGNEFQSPLQMVFFLFATLASYVYAARLPSDFTKVIHPLVTSTGMVWGLVRIFAELTGSNFMTELGTYKTGSLNWREAGAGDYLLYMLGPSVVSFGISMYSKRILLKENLPVVLTSMLVSAGGGLYGTAFFVRLLQIGGTSGGKLVRLSLLPRNVTTALAMAISTILGGDISITASVVVMSGIIGATYGRTILDAMGVKDPIARGLSMGASGQGLGVSALVPEPDAFPFAAMSMVLTAVCATSLVSIPSIKDQLVSIATGA